MTNLPQDLCAQLVPLEKEHVWPKNVEGVAGYFAADLNFPQHLLTQAAKRVGKPTFLAACALHEPIP